MWCDNRCAFTQYLVQTESKTQLSGVKTEVCPHGGAPAFSFLLFLCLRRDGASFGVGFSCPSFPDTSCWAVCFLLWEGHLDRDASAGSSLTCGAGDAWLDLSFLLGEDRCAEGQVCWFRHMEHSGPTGKHTCCPKPTSNQLISLHRSLQQGKKTYFNETVLMLTCRDER